MNIQCTQSAASLVNLLEAEDVDMGQIEGGGSIALSQQCLQVVSTGEGDDILKILALGSAILMEYATHQLKV